MGLTGGQPTQHRLHSAGNGRRTGAGQAATPPRDRRDGVAALGGQAARATPVVSWNGVSSPIWTVAYAVLDADQRELLVEHRARVAAARRGLHEEPLELVVGVADLEQCRRLPCVAISSRYVGLPRPIRRRWSSAAWTAGAGCRCWWWSVGAAERWHGRRRARPRCRWSRGASYSGMNGLRPGLRLAFFGSVVDLGLLPECALAAGAGGGRPCRAAPHDGLPPASATTRRAAA